MRKSSRFAAIVSVGSLLAACHSSGGGGGGGTSPPPPTPQTYAVTVTDVEAVRAADRLALPVAGLPSSPGGSIIVTP